MATVIDKESGGVLGVIFRDLKPLRNAYEDEEAGRVGITEIPEDLESLVSSRDLDDDPRVVGWRYTVPWTVRLRGVPVKDISLQVNGVTIVFGPPDAPDEVLVLRRYVDWADVWAQQGVSSGRGELDFEQVILDPEHLPPPEDEDS